MKDNILEYLINYGFNKEELKQFQRKNEKLYFANLENIKDNIEFLTTKDLTKEEIIEVIRKNNFMLTCSNKKKIMLDNIYNKYFTKQELKELIIKYPYTYILNPINLNEDIENLKQHNSNDIDIKNFIIKNIDIKF